MADLIRVLERADLSPMDVPTARQIWRMNRVANGWGPHAPLLTQPDGNVKYAKSVGQALIYGLSLAPAGASGHQVCRWRTKACEAGCVAYSGKGGLAGIMEARVLKTRFLASEPQAFVTLVAHEIAKAVTRHGAEAIAVRLNTFSDLPWERLVPWLFERFAGVQFYDYTKAPDRSTPANYHLTRSATERMGDDEVVALVEGGQNVAVVMSPSRHKDLPATWNGLIVIDGDKTDVRYLDPKGVVVGLRAKGTMRRNPMGMVKEVLA